MNNYKIMNGSMLEELDKLEKESIDNIVTDPPYELNFMGKDWDNIGISFKKETWEKCLKVLKPGGYLLAFGGSRTFHRIACAIEDAGFEIRDTIMWLYGSGFPKSMNIGLAIDKKSGVESEVIGQNEDILKKQAKDLREGHRKILDSLNAGAEERNNGFSNVSADIKVPTSEEGKKWQGWGTSLKPSFEPIIVARKPFKNSLVDNVIENSIGALNIDECRILTDELKGKVYNNSGENLSWGGTYGKGTVYGNEIGRFPANMILTYDETDFDEVCNGFPQTESTGGSGIASKSNTFKNTYNGGWGHSKDCSHLGGLGDSGSAARYFYNAERTDKDVDGDRPMNLYQYLIRLISPKNANILYIGNKKSVEKAVEYENEGRNCNYKYVEVNL